MLNLAKVSVSEFVEYMNDFIPEETLIISAAEVKNKFQKKKRFGDDSDWDDSEESDGDLPIEDGELPWAKEIKAQINKEFSRNKNPEPLF